MMLECEKEVLLRALRFYIDQGRYDMADAEVLGKLVKRVERTKTRARLTSREGAQ